MRARRFRIGAILIVAVLALGAIGLLASAVLAESPPNLAPVSAQALLASSLTALSNPVTISGDVRTRIDLGLPDLPSALNGATGAGTANALTSLIGTQQYKVWSSLDGLRVQHPMNFQEQDLVANKTTAWFWDSATNTATELRTVGLAASLPAQVRTQANSDASTPPGAADVIAIARQALQAAGTCGAVAISGTSRVAGRDAYDLTFTPSSSVTRVGSVSVAIDARTRLPLEVQVVPRGADTAAIEVGFTRVSFAPIDPSMFTFSPPAGATVHNETATVSSAIAHVPAHDASEQPAFQSQTPVTFGNCLDMRIAVPLLKPLPTQVNSMLPYAGPLACAITVVRSGNTWLLVGLVDVTTLEKDAASLP